jgi:hypothetical protein
VLATLRRFMREGSPWRSLHAMAEQASGSILERFLNARADKSYDASGTVTVPCLSGQAAPGPAMRPARSWELQGNKRFMSMFDEAGRRRQMASGL